MATIPNTKEKAGTEGGAKNRSGYKWETITQADTPDSVLTQGGEYTCTVQGTFDGASIEFMFSKDNVSFHSIDVANLTFSSAGSYGFKSGVGYVKPVISGGTTTSLNAYLSPILMDES